MKTFSSMSTPDKILTRQSYRRNLAFIRGMLNTDRMIDPRQTEQLNNDARRLQDLIGALEDDLQGEHSQTRTP